MMGADKQMEDRRQIGRITLALAATAAITLGVLMSGCNAAPEVPLASNTAYAQGIIPPPNQDSDRLPRGIITVGTGELMAAPDTAYVTVGVQAEATTARQAINQASGIANEVITAVRRLGVGDPQIRTTDISLQPIYDQPRQPRPGEIIPPREGPPPIIGYRSANQVRITITNLAQVGQVIDAATEAGANLVGGIQFTIQNDAELRGEALRRAALEARAEAEVLASALGLRIIGVHSVVEEQVFSGPRPVADFATTRALGAPEMAPPVQPGELTIRASVRVMFSHG
jgi:uncharacterized protein